MGSLKRHNRGYIPWEGSMPHLLQRTGHMIWGATCKAAQHQLVIGVLGDYQTKMSVIVSGTRRLPAVFGAPCTQEDC